MNSLMQRWQRVVLLLKGPDSTSAVGLLILLFCLLAVTWAALFPSGGGEAASLGRWETMIPPEETKRAILVDYQADSGRLALMLDPNERDLLVRAKKRFVNAHIRKFNKHVAGRAFKREGLVKGPADGLFSVSISKGTGGGLSASLVSRDLSIYDMYPVGQRSLKDLGPIHFAPDEVKQPYFSDGHLGFFLDPRGVEDAVGRRLSLVEDGVFNGKSIILTDHEGLPRARVRATADGNGVDVAPLGNHAVFLENNPPMDGEGIVVSEGQVAEIGGRFFEAHIADAATMAVTREKAGSVKRVYPMGRLFHIVGPLALDGAHQSLGIEYMFQEYLMGAPEEDVAPGELWLTIDERLQAQLDAGLQELSGISRRGVASALIMNSGTGAVLAMSASPKGYDPENRDQVMDLLSRGRETFYNHGCFKRHVVGSVTKAFYGFLGMQVLGEEVTEVILDVNAPTTKTLYGHRLYGSRQKEMEIKRASVSFSDYLIRSDNAYQHALGFLLLGGVTRLDEDLNARWFYRDRQGRPHLRPLSNEGVTPLEFNDLGRRPNSLRIDPTAPLSRQLEEVFGISTASGKGVLNDRDISIYGEPFLDLAERVLQLRKPLVDRPREVLKARSVVCAPETPRMELAEVRNTMDATNVLYGANRNRWTDVKLCEAFSRMVTGKRVEARIVSRFRDSFTGELVDLEAAARAETPALEVPNPAAFAEMRRILERIPMGAGAGYPEGTGHLLQPHVQRLRRQVPGFKLVGKTGTIDDGRKGDPDSRLFLGTFGIADADGFTEQSYTFVVYLKNALDPDALFAFIGEQLPQWWALLEQKTSQIEPSE